MTSSRRSAAGSTLYVPKVSKSRRYAHAIARPALRHRDQYSLGVILGFWISAGILFWFWWLRPEHVGSLPLFVCTTVALAYDFTLMPLVFVFFLTKMRIPAPVAAPAGLRVAMVTAIVPSAESIEVLEGTLTGMVNVRYPHDNWVLDEGGDPRVRALCERLGAYYWTRKGKPEFNQAAWPYQAKTKSGNYNSWFSQVAYEHYDYFVQLDTDHAPAPTYLDDVLGYFRDPEVGYVALPSVYRNLEDWPARVSSEQSQIFHGPLQMGYYGWAKSPMIIGSHAAYRTAAIKEIGGFSPSRAEDHLDTLWLAQAGYTGVFVPKILAVGLGPHTLSDYLSQEHQWAFSVMQVLLKYGRNKGGLNWRQKSIFLFQELWYAIFALSYLVLWVLPLIALVTNTPIAHVPFLQFVLYALPLTCVSLVALVWTRRHGWLKPDTHFFLSWRGVLLGVGRWPVVLSALVGATISILFRKGRFTYLVTPKGNGPRSTLAALRTQLHIVIPGLLPIPIMLTYPFFHADEPNRVAGYVFFALSSSVLYTALFLVAAASDLRHDVVVASHKLGTLFSALPRLAIGSALVTGLVGSAMLNSQPALASLSTWPSPVSSESGIGLRDYLVSVAAGTPPPIRPLPAVQSWLFDGDSLGTTFGAYDPTGELDSVSNLDHLFISWSDDLTGGIPVGALRADYTKGRPVMMSVEPWPIKGYPSDNLLRAIAAGDYDTVVAAQARTVSALRQPILIRFGHEMDMGDLYPWSGAAPDEYIAAFRHVVDMYRAEGATNALWVWSPGGMKGAEAYYPGDEYVDYIGVTVLEYGGWESRLLGLAKPRPFADLIGEKYNFMLHFDKPMIVAEAGVDLPGDQKADRLNEMIAKLPDFPRIRAVLYFNEVNPTTNIVPDTPEWGLNRQDVVVLKQALKASRWVQP